MALESFDRKIAKQALLEWWLSRKPFDRVFNEVLREHRVGSNERIRISALVYNYIRFLGLLLPRPVKPESPTWLREFEASLEKATQDFATLEKRHEEAKPRFAQDALKHLSDLHMVPPFLLSEFTPSPAGWHDYLHASLIEAPLFVRLNPSKLGPKAFLERFAKYGAEATWLPNCYRFPKRWAINQDQAYLDGAFEIQDEHSQVVAWVAAPKPGERVLDLCAGAGGKTLQLASMMDGKGEIVAYDLDRKKLVELAARARRAGINNVRVSEGLPKRDNLFDVVVVDAPCSGLGTLRRNPDRLYTITEADLKGLARVQLEIAERACGYLKPGGRLVYATCTVRPQENEAIVRRLIDKHGRKLVSAPQALRQSVANAGADAANFLSKMAQGPASRIAAPYANDIDLTALLHLAPYREPSQGSGGNGGDGFFVALLN